METKELKSADEVRQAAEAANIDLSKPIVLSCQAGVAATVVYAALSNVASGQLAVYDGSYSEYSSKK